MIKLKTTYMGLQLEHPLVASASPLASSSDGVLSLQKAGAAAVVLPSLFEEQIEQERQALEHHLDFGEGSSQEATGYFVESKHYTRVSEQYLKLVEECAKWASVPIVASLNAYSDYGWIDIAEEIEQAGASALELNIYSLPTDFSMSSVAVENKMLAILKSVRARVSIPLALKIGPYYSALGNLAKRFESEGADALVLFNRFYQPDFDIENREIESTLLLSSENEIRLPLTWIGMLHGELKLSLAASTGVNSYIEIVKYLMAGADVVMTTSALLRNGPGYITVLLRELEDWMLASGYHSIDDLRGSMNRENVGNPKIYERVQYMKMLHERASEVKENIARVQDLKRGV